jgi:predicted site-specific integrase-resolvase
MSEFANTEKPMRLQTAADFLGVCLKTMTRLKDEGKLQAFKIRGRWFTRMSYVQAYIDQQLQTAKGRQPC